MAVQKIRLGNNEDGSPHYLYRSDDPNGHIVVTGPNISGTVEVDGKEIDVSEFATEVDSLATAQKVADAVAERFATEGHPAMVGDGEEFVYLPTSATHDKNGNVKSAFETALVENPTYTAAQLRDSLAGSKRNSTKTQEG